MWILLAAEQVYKVWENHYQVDSAIHVSHNRPKSGNARE